MIDIRINDVKENDGLYMYMMFKIAKPTYMQQQTLAISRDYTC